MTHLIGISGKKGRGKNLIGKIIQYLCSTHYHYQNYNMTFNDFNNTFLALNNTTNWKIKKVAFKLKLITFILKGEFEKTFKRKRSSWIITNVKFPNQAKAVTDRGGIMIRVNRNMPDRDNITKQKAETALDHYAGFDYVLQNNGTVEELIEQVKEILILEKII